MCEKAKFTTQGRQPGWPGGDYFAYQSGQLKPVYIKIKQGKFTLRHDASESFGWKRDLTEALPATNLLQIEFFILDIF